MLLVRDERHPFNNLLDTLEVVVGGHVRHTILVHDLSATELQVGCVYFTTKHLVQRRSTCQDNWLAFDLDGTLSKTNKVSTDTNGSTSNQCDGEDILVGSRGRTSDQARATKTLNTKTILGADDSSDLMTLFAVFHDLLGLDFGLLDRLSLLWCEIKVFEA